MIIDEQKNFIEELIDSEIQAGTYSGRVHTRFPPEPNGYLHIGHAKSICLNFGLAKKYGGKCNIRFDDTNPTKEESHYIEAIKRDVEWLGFSWDEEHYASDYFDQLYEWAELLITKGKAYVDTTDGETLRLERGTVTTPGKESCCRNASVEENLRLFREMKAGKHPEGSMVLRAKIDMSNPNMLLRDPLMYRIMHTSHHRTGDKWCIYPLYDYAHGQSDSLEKITNSICTLEFSVHRPLYEWFIKELDIFPSKQTEFARLNLTYTIMSKRKLLLLVEGGYVTGWDDARMPTISGLRRRGYTPTSLQSFASKIGVAKRDNTIEVELLEFCLREDLNKTASRRMGVLNPIKLTITNYDKESEIFSALDNPEADIPTYRDLIFSKDLYIENEDFREEADNKFYRLKRGGYVRLKYGYIVKCDDVVKDASGKIVEILCTYFPETKGKNLEGVKVKGVIHWVSRSHALEVQVNLFDNLFLKSNPEECSEGRDFTENINPNSLTISRAFVEPSLALAEFDVSYQFERIAYFCLDRDSRIGVSKDNLLIFNRTISLKDSFKG